MRQKGDDVLIDILSRLRKGTCTQADKDILDEYVLNHGKHSDQTRELIDAAKWTDGEGCPLITYRNESRDMHNVEMAKTYGRITEQEAVMYHSIDTRGRGRKLRELKGMAAEAAWRVPVKNVRDLPGRVPYLTGMPVFCTENMATELGLSKGCMGTIVSIRYVERDGRRYAVSAEVDFPGFKGDNEEHPNRVLLSTHSESFQFKLPNSDTKYTARRKQLPLIPVFAFTSHNSQGRTLERACIDLASCTTIQSAYVMLSRVKSLKGLCILRPFRLEAIQKHISEELRQELARTEELEKHTIAASRTRLDWYYRVFPTDTFPREQE
jgi:hypothetical protein